MRRTALRTLVDVVSRKAYFELLLLKTDHTPLVSARSCVAALASQPSSFHVCFAPDTDRNADIAEGPSWALKQLRLSGKSRRMEDGTSVSSKGATLYENWTIPAGVWLIAR
jgi:hypothetical protein